MSDMPCPRRMTPGDGRVTRQGTSLLYIAGEKTKASAPWGNKNACTRICTGVFLSFCHWLS